LAFEEIYRGYILIDTSAIYALLNKSDSRHQEAQEALEVLNGEEHKLFVCNLTIYESFTRLRYDVGWDVAAELWRFLSITKPNYIEFQRSNEEDTYKLLSNYRGIKLSYHDAGCSVLMLKHRIGRIFSFDDDFNCLGFERYPW